MTDPTPPNEEQDAAAREIIRRILDERCPVLEEEERQAEWSEREREEVWDG